MNPKNVLARFTVIIALLLSSSGCLDLFQSDTERALELVQSGTLGLDKSISVQNAMDTYPYFENVFWEVFETERGRIVVETKGMIDLQKFIGIKPIRYYATEPISQMTMDDFKQLANGQAEYVIQFSVNKDLESFQVTWSGFLFGFPEGFFNKVKDKDIKFLNEIYQGKPFEVVLEIAERYRKYLREEVVKITNPPSTDIIESGKPVSQSNLSGEYVYQDPSFEAKMTITGSKMAGYNVSISSLYKGMYACQYEGSAKNNGKALQVSNQNNDELVLVEIKEEYLEITTHCKDCCGLNGSIVSKYFKQ